MGERRTTKSCVFHWRHGASYEKPSALPRRTARQKPAPNRLRYSLRAVSRLAGRSAHGILSSTAMATHLPPSNRYTDTASQFATSSRTLSIHASGEGSPCFRDVDSSYAGSIGRAFGRSALSSSMPMPSLAPFGSPYSPCRAAVATRWRASGSPAYTPSNPPGIDNARNKRSVREYGLTVRSSPVAPQCPTPSNRRPPAR